MATLGVFPDHAQGRLPYNALPSIPSRTLYLPTAPVPLGHSSTTAHRMESFLQWLPPLLFLIENIYCTLTIEQVLQ